MKKQYTAPLLTVVAVNVERGYAASMTEPLRLSDVSRLNTEERTESSGWTFDDDENFWNNTF